MRTVVTCALLLATLTPVTGCGERVPAEPGPKTPEEAFESFRAALDRDDWPRIYRRLLAPSVRVEGEKGWSMDSWAYGMALIKGFEMMEERELDLEAPGSFEEFFSFYNRDLAALFNRHSEDAPANLVANAKGASPTEVRVDGDRATVEFAGPAGRGSLYLVRERGRWFLALNQMSPPEPETP